MRSGKNFAGLDPEEWERRLKFRYPMLRYFTDRTFGMEIETFGLKYTVTPGDREVIPPYKIMTRSADGTLLPQVFQSQGINLSGYSPDEDPYKGWCFVLDDSIKGAGGSELVSPILCGLKGLAQAYEVLLLLQEFPELQANETCGFHVHHGVNPSSFGNHELFQLLRIVAIFEDYIFYLLPEERRGADTCRPSGLDLFEWYRRDGGGPPPPWVKHLWYSPENLDDPTVPESRKLHPTRYHGLNLHSYWYRGTIEFRYFPAMLERPEELIQWILFSQFLVEWSAGRRPKIDYVSPPNKWLNTLYKIYMASGMISHIRFPRDRKSTQKRGKP
jgi:hypothetical protein